MLSSSEALTPTKGTGDGCSCWAEESGDMSRRPESLCGGQQQTCLVGQRLGHNPPAPDMALCAGLAPELIGPWTLHEPAAQGAIVPSHGPEAVTCSSVSGLRAQSPCAKSI